MEWLTLLIRGYEMVKRLRIKGYGIVENYESSGIGRLRLRIYCYGMVEVTNEMVWDG